MNARSRRRALSRRVAVLAAAVAALCCAPGAHPGARDDTAWLQARLDAGGAVSIPRLPGGACYATRGLWVSRDDTSISSDGACIVALGPGAARPATDDGLPIRASAVFFVHRSSFHDPAPVRVSIDGLRISVPARARMDGIDVLGHEITISHVVVDGAPLRDVSIGAGLPGAANLTARVAVFGSTLRGGREDVLRALGPVGLRVEGSTLAGARGSNAAGLRVAAADRGQPVLDVHVAGNTIADNAGAGVALELAARNGPAVLASGIDLDGNRLLRNGRRAPAPRRAAILVSGNAAPTLEHNVFAGNRGPQLRRLAVTTTPVATPAPLGPRPPGGDDTAWLQARLDSGGGTIFLPKLPGGACYATRGLWVSHDSTTITSDGACLVALGPGPVRLRSIDGDPIAADAVFFVNRSSAADPAPVDVTIANLRIVVPDESLYGVAVFGHRVTLTNLTIGGAPKDDVLIGGRANGNGFAADVAILGSTLRDAARNAISAFGVIGLRIEGDTIEGVRDSPPGQPAAGIDVEPDERAQPTLDVRIAHNTIRGNAGPGLLLPLDSNSGPSVLASGLVLDGNTIVGNALAPSPPRRAGIVVAGGQDGGAGTLALTRNVVRGNGGPGILWIAPRLVVSQSGNDIEGNEGDASAFRGTSAPEQLTRPTQRPRRQRWQTPHRSAATSPQERTAARTAATSSASSPSSPSPRARSAKGRRSGLS